MNSKNRNPVSTENSKFLRRVVFPAPRNPVRTVQGIFSDGSAMFIRLDLAKSLSLPLQARLSHTPREIADSQSRYRNRAIPDSVLTRFRPGTAWSELNRVQEASQFFSSSFFRFLNSPKVTKLSESHQRKLCKGTPHWKSTIFEFQIFSLSLQIVNPRLSCLYDVAGICTTATAIRHAAADLLWLSTAAGWPSVWFCTGPVPGPHAAVRAGRAAAPGEPSQALFPCA